MGDSLQSKWPPLQKYQDHKSHKRLRNSLQLKEIKDTEQLSVNCDSGLDPRSIPMVVI